MTTSHVKRTFKYRFCPTDAQAAELSRTFGCVRKVYRQHVHHRVIERCPPGLTCAELFRTARQIEFAAPAN